MFQLDASATSGQELQSLWQNASLDRRLDATSRRKVLESMVSDGEACERIVPLIEPRR